MRGSIRIDGTAPKVRFGSGVIGSRMRDAAKQPDHQKNDHDRAENASQPSTTVASVGVVPTASTEQQDQHQND